MMKNMDPSVAATLTLISTMVLVGVTAWYAVLTRRLAKSAEASAASAERTVQIATEALSATVASLDVSFEVAPNLHGASGAMSVLGVTIHGDGATVFVHRARLDEAWVCVGKRSDGASFDCIAEDVELVLATGDLANPGNPALPTRLHRGEMLHFQTFPEVAPDRRALADQLKVSIWYSVDAVGPQVLRRVEYDAAD